MDDTGNLCIDEIAERTRIAARRADPDPPLKLVFVDCLQLIPLKPDGDLGPGRDHELVTICVHLRQLARALGLAVLLTSDLERRANDEAIAVRRHADTAMLLFSNDEAGSSVGSRKLAVLKPFFVQAQYVDLDFDHWTGRFAKKGMLDHDLFTPTQKHPKPNPTESRIRRLGPVLGS